MSVRSETMSNPPNHARVTANHREADLNLGHWIGTQRKGYSQGTLDSEREARLAALRGWSWDARRRQSRTDRTEGTN